jgi:hypothetical protein
MGFTVSKPPFLLTGTATSPKTRLFLFFFWFCVQVDLGTHARLYTALHIMHYTHTHTHRGTHTTLKPVFVYYEEIKRELNRILIYECRCDERLKLKVRDLHSSHTLGCVETLNPKP